jgi:hypothetical protein
VLAPLHGLAERAVGQSDDFHRRIAAAIQNLPSGNFHDRTHGGIPFVFDFTKWEQEVAEQAEIADLRVGDPRREIKRTRATILIRQIDADERRFQRFRGQAAYGTPSADATGHRR